MSTTTATAPARYTVERIDGTWSVVKVTDTGREVVDTYTSRDKARLAARDYTANEPAPAPAEDLEPEQREAWDDPDPIAGPDGLGAREMTDAEHAEWAADLDAQAQEESERAHAASKACAEVYAELHPELDRTAKDSDTLLAELHERVNAPKVKAPTSSRVTLARVKVGDRLMTNLVGNGNGVVQVQPHRFSDGQVRTVAEVTTRKASDGEMPGTLYCLVFTDGTVSEERYGTTSHYPAEVFEGGPAPQDANVERVLDERTVPAPKKAAAPKAPKVETVPSRAGKLAKGSRLVLRDLGVVTVDQVSKTGDGKLEVAYTTADDVSGVREMWSSTNVRIAS